MSLTLGRFHILPSILFLSYYIQVNSETDQVRMPLLGKF